MNIKKMALVLLRLCISRDYRCIKMSRAFDFIYFLKLQEKSNVDIWDPIWTYVKNYKIQKKRTQNVVEDWSQQVEPHRLFDTSYYLLQYFPDGLNSNPFAHYLRYGWKKGYQPGPYFNTEFYKSRSGWKVSDGNPLAHYNCNTRGNKESASFTLDAEFYFDRNPFFAGSQREILEEYKSCGALIGKSPLPVFDPEFYLEQIAPNKSAMADLFAHYLRTANASKFFPGKLFDPDFYLQECSMDLTRSDALLHYVSQGVFAGIYCHPRVAKLTNTPLISVVVPVYNPDLGVLRNCIRSVLYQAYPHWELCLADDCSPDAAVRSLLEEWATKDSRIKITFLPKNGGISKATNEAEKLASGDYLGFLDNDDELTVDCLLEVVEAINAQNADLVYSDEDLIGDDGRTLSVFRKPDFNPGLLLSHNYITHFVVVKRSLFRDVGRFCSTYDGAQDYDLMLKLSEVCDNIVHIPKVLYHWRASESSTNINHEQKEYANEAGRLALQAAVTRRGFGYEVQKTELNFFYHLFLTGRPRARFIVLVWAVEKDECHPELLTDLSKGGDGNHVEYVVVIKEQSHKRICSQLEDLGLVSWKVVPLKDSETRAAALHRLMSASDREFIVLLDGSIQKLSEKWFMELYSPLCRPDVAMVCGRTTYDGGDGESYLLPDITNEGALYLQVFLTSTTRHMVGLHSPQDVSYGSWDIAMLRKEDYETVGGLRYSEFPELFAVAELSIRLEAHGKIVNYTPFAIGDKKVETGCKANDEAIERQVEKHAFQALLQQREDVIDPFYNPSILTDNGVDETRFGKWLRDIR